MFRSQSLQDFAISAIAEFIAKIKQTPQFSQELTNILHILGLGTSHHHNVHPVKERLFLSLKNGMDSLAFSLCPIYKSYIGQTNRKQTESTLLIWATDRLSAQAGAADCIRSRDTVIHSAVK